ncbi:putative N-ethylammeline chlorohydrolase [Bradyrhizobium diazoefficiens]|uniref:Putative N-ethylammeline chlorohydrolase n=2 Tax=Nitrobacteraceae TaxID=41294 RepID=A0A0E4BQI6_9BRAD|nr:putative N-ethylammeline chlorohydrolase [Bradyrhizobium diazoefficiens]
MPALSLPGIVRAESQSTLRFIPVIDLAFVDPIYSTAQVSRNHGFMVYDTLYGMSSSLQVSPQMLSGHTISGDGLQWDLTLRDGLFWHDGERVLARDCVASIRRWAARDGFGGELMEATAELSATDDRTIRFRLKRPFPLLPQALGKAAINACFMMPERLASQDPFKPLTEVIGSGPFRYLADERVQGARNAYAKFERYQPRTDGKPDWTAGPKIVHYDRVVWTTTPDAGTGVAALQTGEQDWQETTPHDLLPIIKAAGDIDTRILDPRGYACMLRLNHLQPPFDNPAVRRALLGAIDQSAFMTAVAGTDPAFQVSPIGYFAPGTPMASEVGLDVFRGPRDYAKVKADLKAAGYNGEKIVLLVPTNSLAQKPLGEIAVDSLRKAGMNVEYAGLDFAERQSRRLVREREDGGLAQPVAGGLRARRAAAHLPRDPGGGVRGNPLYSDRPVQAADRLSQGHHRHSRRHRRVLERTPRMSTIAIFGSYVLSRKDGAQDVLRDHWVLVEGKKIAAVTRDKPSADEVYDRPGRFVLPGLLNLHNHCFSEAVARSHSEDGNGRKNNQSIVYTVLLPLTKRGADILSAEERMAVARLGILQLLKGGATTVMEPFRNSIPEMFDAAEEMGIRFYGAPYLFSTSDAKAGSDGVVQYSGDDGAADMATWDALYQRWNNRGDGRISLAMSPHATDTCGPDLLKACAARARELGVPITTHMAQSRGEVETIGKRYGGRTPAEYLDWLGLLAPDLMAEHCMFSTDDDLKLMAARGMTVLNCPRVFARAGVTAAFSRFAEHGVRTVVGTDGYNMDLLGELNAASLISKITSKRADVANSPELIEANTAVAADVVKRPDLGRIEPGATADLTVVDLTHPHLQPLFDPRRALIALANRANIDQVIVDGRVLVEGGRYLGADEAAITAAGSAAIGKIWDLPEAQAAFNG